MPVVEELWNNATSPYKNWHKKIKWFSIFTKSNKCQKFRKQKQTRKREKLTWPGPAAQQAGPASWPCQSSPSSCQEDKGTRSPPARMRATSCFSPRRLDRPNDATRRPAPLSLSPVPILSSPSLSLTVERCRRHRPPLP